MLTTPANPYHHHHHHNQSQRKRDVIYEIPFWIGNEQRRVLVSGIKKMTTCQDVIRNLVPSFSHQDPTTTFFLVEKWRKMERKLELNELILQVWKAWGDEKREVSFILKKTNQHPSSTTPSTASTIDGIIHHKLHKYKKQNRKPSQQASFHENTPSQRVESMEDLLSLVLKQRETIQIQIKKLRHKEKRIHEYEEKVHHFRSVQEGENYVLNAYLDNSESSSSISPLTFSHQANPRSKSFSSNPIHNHNPEGEQNPIGKKQLQIPTETFHDSSKEESTCEEKLKNSLSSLTLEADLILKILALNKKLRKEENRLVKLGSKIEGIAQIYSSVPHPLPSSPLPENVIGLEQVKIELNAIKEITQEQDDEIQKNEKSLSELDLVLHFKQERLAQLTQEIQSADFQSQVLQKQLTDLTTTKPFETLADVSSAKYFNLSPNLKNTKLQWDPLLGKNNRCDFRSSDACSTQESILNLNEKESCVAEDNDSNSDTGISSLHSSRDENSPLLPFDTLV